MICRGALENPWGVHQLVLAFKIGGTLVLARGFTYPFQVIETLPRERITGFPIVPTIAAILLQMDLSKYEFPSLRYITNTAAALTTAHIILPTCERFSRRSPSFPCTGSRSVNASPICRPTRSTCPASVGRGMPNEEVYLVDDAGNRLAHGQTRGTGGARIEPDEGLLESSRGNGQDAEASPGFRAKGHYTPAISSGLMLKAIFIL
jgi:long-chain acyl-CoA synthetase